MKGIHIQFQGIVNFIDSTLSNNTAQNYDCYLLNLQKITLETFTVINIVFQNACSEVSPQVQAAFENTINKFKLFFQHKPKADSDKYDNDPYEFDEVKYFLENRIDVTRHTNEDQRGELYKFLNQSEERQRSNQILLENIPKFSYGQPNPKRKLFDAIDKKIAIEVECQEQYQQTQPFQIIEGSTQNGNLPLEKEQKQVQTQTSSQAIKQLIQVYIQARKNQDGQKDLDFEDILSSLKNKIKLKKEGKKGGRLNVKKKKSNKLSMTKIEDEDDCNDRGIDEPTQIKKEDKEHKNKQKALQRSSLKVDKSSHQINSSKRDIIYEQAENVNSAAKVKKMSRRSSVNALPKIEKDKISSKASGFNSKNNTPRNGIQPSNQASKINSKLSELKKVKQENQNPLSENKRLLPGKAEQQSQLIQVENSNHEKIQIEITQVQAIHQDQKKPNSAKIQEAIDRQDTKQADLAENDDKFRLSDLLDTEEDKTKPWDNQSGLFSELSPNNNQYRHQSILQRKNSSQLPPVLDRSKLQFCRNSAQLLSHKSNLSKYKSSQASNENLNESSLKKLRHINHQSLHQRQTQSMLPSKFANVPLYRNEQSPKVSRFPLIKEEEPVQGEFLLKFAGLSAEEKKELLNRENIRIMNEIGETAGLKKNKNVQWIRLMRNIKEYEAIHTGICGENCIHLKKFYEFLKKRNLTMYVNRKLLQVHKKNIEIGISNE